MLPGSNSAREAVSVQSRKALDKSGKRNRFVTAAPNWKTHKTGRVLETMHLYKPVFKPIYFAW
jgi:hypothetical protein